MTSDIAIAMFINSEMLLPNRTQAGPVNAMRESGEPLSLCVVPEVALTDEDGELMIA